MAFNHCCQGMVGKGHLGPKFGRMLRNNDVIISCHFHVTDHKLLLKRMVRNLIFQKKTKETIICFEISFVMFCHNVFYFWLFFGHFWSLF